MGGDVSFGKNSATRPRASERGEGLLTTIDFRLAGDASGNIPYKGGMDVRKAD